MFVLVAVVLCSAAFAVFHLRDYLRAVRVCLQLDGPAAVPLIGNTTLLLRKDCERIVCIHMAWHNSTTTYSTH